MLFRAVAFLLLASANSGNGEGICPDGSEPMSAYFEYELTIPGLDHDCKTNALSRMEEAVDEAVIKVQQDFTSESAGDEVIITKCNEVYDPYARRSLRHGDASLIRLQFRRTLGIYSRTGGGYCRRCTRRRRELGKGGGEGGGKTIEEVIVEEEALVEEIGEVIAEEEQIVDAEVQTVRLSEWIKDLQNAIEVEVTMVLGNTKCITSFNNPRVVIEVLDPAASLPCGFGQQAL